MQDTLIEFDTAKLAKEKGYILDSTWNVRLIYNLKDGEVFAEQQQQTPKHGCERCSQSLLQKWLREKHNIHISIDFAQADDNTINWYIQISEMTWVKKDLKYIHIF